MLCWGLETEQLSVYERPYYIFLHLGRNQYKLHPTHGVGTTRTASLENGGWLFRTSISAQNRDFQNKAKHGRGVRTANPHLEEGRNTVAEQRKNAGMTYMRNEQRPHDTDFSYALIAHRLSRWHRGKESTCPMQETQETRFNP